MIDYFTSLLKIKNDVYKYPSKNSLSLFRFLVKKYWLDYVPHPSSELLEKLKTEELSELSSGMDADDPLEIIDGLCDVIFVLMQDPNDKLSYDGIEHYLQKLSKLLKVNFTYEHLVHAFCIVVASNYTKLNLVDGKPSPIFNNYGKIMKPETFVDAKLELIEFLDKLRE